MTTEQCYENSGLVQVFVSGGGNLMSDIDLDMCSRLRTLTAKQMLCVAVRRIEARKQRCATKPTSSSEGASAGPANCAFSLANPSWSCHVGDSVPGAGWRTKPEVGADVVIVAAKFEGRRWRSALSRVLAPL